MNRTRERLLGMAWVAVPPLIAFGLAGIFLISSRTISGPEAVYPIGIAIAVLAVGLLNLVRDGLARYREVERAPGTDGEAGTPAGSVPRTLLFIALLIGSALLLELAGFFFAMTVMVVGSLLVFGVRRIAVIAAAAFLMIGTAYLIFVRVLVVPFPEGFLGLT